MTKRDWALFVAKKFYGHFYTWGGDDPSSFDCSGLIIECLKSVGSLPRKGDWTAAQLADMFPKLRGFMGREIVIENGDLVFWQGLHLSKCGPSQEWNSNREIIHVEMVVDIELGLSIGASGGGSKVKTREDAIKANAFIKIRPISSRAGVWGYCDPY